MQALLTVPPMSVACSNFVAVTAHLRVLNVAT